jgi:uncharacterized damage-inducible protein DinB
MRVVLRSIACACLLAAAGSAILGQAPAPAKPAVGTLIPPAQIYEKMLSSAEKNFVDAAEAMPEDKFNFAPTQGEFKGVRTFAEEVKHVAIANTFFFHDPSQPLADTRAEMNKLATKAEIVKALKDSFAQGHALIAGITPENAYVQTANGTRAELAARGIAHFMDHYGQMCVYLRMNGIVPPASRGN